MELRSAGSGFVEVLLGYTSSPQPWALTFGVPEGRRGFKSTRKGQD